MDYSKAARDVIDALKSVRDADEGIWWHRAMIAIADLFPMSALAYALHQPDVWPRQRRQQVRADTNPPSRAGFFLDDLIATAEAAAAADGTRIVHETHLARAFAESAQALQVLGIATDALLVRTSEREAPLSTAVGPKRPRVLGTARIEVLDDAVRNQSLEPLLSQDERTGTVERKRSILNTGPGALADHEQVAVCLVNGSPDTPVFLIFGQDDDFTILGEVDHRGTPLDPETVRKCQRALDNRLQACHPPVPVKWEALVREGKRVWIACMLGRARGTAVRTSIGSYPYRSGEDCHFATPELITTWRREPADSDMEGPTAADPAEVDERATPTDDHNARDEGLQQRQALATLEESVESFFKAPPAIPNSIRGRKLDDWRPVFEPVLAHFQPAIKSVVAAAIDSQDMALDRLMRGVRVVFRLRQPQSGLTWIVEAPRLVTRLIADRLMVEAYCTEQWARLQQIGHPSFDSYIGRIPWVLAPEYRHPETLGRDAGLASELSLQEIAQNSDRLHQLGVTDTKIASSYAAITVGLSLGTMAREEASSRSLSGAAWAMLRGAWAELETWEDEPEVINAFANLAGEPPNTFRRELARRLGTIVRAYRSTGYFIDIPDAAEASIKRIADQATDSKPPT